MNGIYIQQLGLVLPPGKKKEATALVEEGYRRALNKADAILYLVDYLLITGNKQGVLAAVAQRLKLDPGQLDELMSLLGSYDFTSEELQSVLPQSVDMWVRYGSYLEKQGDMDGAGYYRVGALEFLEKEKDIRPHWFNQLISYYRKTKQPAKMIETIRMGLKYLPDYAPYHLWLGDYYKEEGITYRAKEEYEQAVMLDPRNKGYRQKLRKLELDIEFGD